MWKMYVVDQCLNLYIYLSIDLLPLKLKSFWVLMRSKTRVLTSLLLQNICSNKEYNFEDWYVGLITGL